MRSLPGIVAGSWVYGNFSTWIGSKDKNHAWDLLCVAKQSFDMVMASGRLSQAEQDAAEKQLCSCESSDWFWWFGDYNPSHSVASFDRLFRHNLTELYHLLKLPPRIICPNLSARAVQALPRQAERCAVPPNSQHNHLC